MSLSPLVQNSPVPGLVFDRSQGHQFRPLTSPSGDFYWKPNLMAVVRRCADLAYFLPSAEFSDAGGKVTFTRFSGNDELLTKTVGLDEAGVKMPGSTYSKLQEALAKFKAMANDPDLTPDEARFVSEFKLPDRQQFPGAYRVLKTSWYTSDRLFVLWGLEPSSAGGVPVIKILAGAGNAPSTRPTGERKGDNDQGSKPNGASTVPPVVPVPAGPPAKNSTGDPAAGSTRGPVPVGNVSAAATVGGAGTRGASALGAAGIGHGGTVVTESLWRRRGCWRGCLWLLLPALLILLLLLLLSQCTPASCSGDNRGEAEQVFPRAEKHEGAVTQPEWWKPVPDVEKKQSRTGRVLPLDKRKPAAPGQFEVYIHNPTQLVQRPPAAEVHLGLRYHGEGKIKDVTWTLSDGSKEQGEFLDERLPFDGDLVASAEIDVTFTYVDANGVEREDGFSFRYVLQAELSFSEQIGDAEDKRTPAEKEAARKSEREAEARKKGA